MRASRYATLVSIRSEEPVADQSMMTVLHLSDFHFSTRKLRDQEIGVEADS